jgi:pyroglutamyl-peptidase
MHAASEKLTKVLVSGFEPFAGASLNPSQLLVEELSRQGIPGIEMSAIILPVEFDRSSQLLLQRVRDFSPEFVIAFGQAEGRKAITPERIAINFDDARIPDNAGNQPQSRKIEGTGADGYFSTLPIEQIERELNDTGVLSSISLSAGTFVCNHLFYRLQHALLNSSIKSGFIHLPLVSEQIEEFPSQPTLELSEMVRGIRAAIIRMIS